MPSFSVLMRVRLFAVVPELVPAVAAVGARGIAAGVHATVVDVVACGVTSELGYCSAQVHCGFLQGRSDICFLHIVDVFIVFTSFSSQPRPQLPSHLRGKGEVLN